VKTTRDVHLNRGYGAAYGDLLEAALALASIFALRSNWRVAVPLEHEKQPGAKPPDRFNRTITLDGPLNEEQREKLLSIAERCPVDLTLVRGSDVQTRLGEPVDAAFA